MWAAAMMNHEVFWKMGKQMPNGDGAFIAGWIESKQGDLDAAERHFNAALTEPCLVDCQRLAAMALTLIHGAQNRSRQVPEAQAAAVAGADIDRLISLGGIRPEKFPQESLVASTGMIYHLYPRVRTLALGWLSHAPEDPGAMYFLAQADSNLNDAGTALAFYHRAISKGLSGGMKADALAQIKQLTPEPATVPATQAH
jgi:hypothetical protein